MKLTTRKITSLTLMVDYDHSFGFVLLTFPSPGGESGREG